LQKDFSALEIVDRSQSKTPANVKEIAPTQKVAFEDARRQAQLAGAPVAIAGTFARIPQGIGITLAILRVDSPNSLGETNGAVTVTDEIKALYPEPIPSIEPGIARGGVGGTTTPTCIKCGFPKYSDAARKAKYQGDVALELLVNAKGNVEEVRVVKNPGLGLGEKAVEAVKRWKLKPAVDVDSKPVPALIPIELTFRLY
jgi:TonB family protein